ncbi:MAG: hypothetical protein U0804_23745 [Gemmataceae bacterium]
MTFSEWFYADEGLLLPDKPRWVGMSRINPWPCTNAERRRLMPRKPKPPQPFAPTVSKVVSNPIRPPVKPLPAVKPFKPVARTPLPKW